MLSPGTQVGNYTIVEPIAGGGMAMVYKAKHNRFGDLAAIKVMLDNLAQNPKARHRFEQEAFVQRQLDHPNIVKVIDVVDIGPTLAMILEYVEGPTMETWLGEHPGPKSESEAMEIMKPVLEAMAYAHKREVVHRDLKPANILMKKLPDGRYQPKVTDFGLVKVLADSGGGLTRTGTMMGTMPYMAPEQALGTKEIDARADVFALSVMLYQLRSGTLPIDPRNLVQVGDYYAGRLSIPSIEGAQGALLERGMSIELAGRLSTAQALLDAPGARAPASTPAEEPSAGSGQAVDKAQAGSGSSRAAISPSGAGAGSEDVPATQPAKEWKDSFWESPGACRTTMNIAAVILVFSILLFMNAIDEWKASSDFFYSGAVVGMRAFYVFAGCVAGLCMVTATTTLQSYIQGSGRALVYQVVVPVLFIAFATMKYPLEDQYIDKYAEYGFVGVLVALIPVFVLNTRMAKQR